MASIPPVISWDYQFAPNAQKSRNYLYATKTPFRICEQPFVMPRPILTDLGVTYRRVPVVSIGRDVFCDTIPFMDAMQQLLGSKGLKTSPADRAFEAWGYRSFWIALALVPASLISPDMSKDRKDLFPVFARADFASLRPNALGEFRSFMEVAENEFLTGGEGPFIGGATEPAMVDVHANWMIKWALHTIDLAQESGFSPEHYPKVWRWIESMTVHNEDAEKGLKISQEEAKKELFASPYAVADIGIDKTDALIDKTGLRPGQTVTVEATDAEPGTYPQAGKLVGLGRHRVVVELDNGLRVHFPRVGYTIHGQ